MPSSQNLVSRSFERMLALVANATGRGESQSHSAEEILQTLQECAAGLGGETSTRQRAARLARIYLDLDDAGRHQFLRLIALEFGPDPAAVALAHADWQAAIGSDAQWDAEAALRRALRSRRLRILTQFNSIPEGVKFLVDMRADLLRFLRDDPQLRALDRELESRLGAWFDVGFLELVRLTWHSPADVLEKLVTYEAVHQIHSWHDLKNRLDSDRRCYAFFHPRMPTEPLIFVEVALTDGLADNVQTLLDIDAPLFDADQATTAIFYSISNTQTGLRGVSFGNYLLKRVIADLQRDFPRLRTFATLSPLPGFTRWADDYLDTLCSALSSADRKRLLAAGLATVDAATLRAVLNDEAAPWWQNPPLADALKAPLLALAASYLLCARRNGAPVDAVARFHLGNGARIEQLNWLADLSPNGLRQSWGVMVNYLYLPERLEDHLEAFVREGRIATAPSIRKQVLPPLCQAAAPEPTPAA